MSGYPGIRASDEDRSRTAAALGEHYAAGRLTLVAPWYWSLAGHVPADSP